MTDTTAKLDPRNPRKGRTDWAALRDLEDADIRKKAESDPDALPLTETELAQMQRAVNPIEIRKNLGVTPAEFAALLNVSPQRVAAWEKKQALPNHSEKLLLKIVETNPAAVEAAGGRRTGRTVTRPYFVVLRRTNQWAVKRIGAKRASSVHSTQKAAIDYAREAARKHGGVLVIHGRDGLIREQHDYSRVAA